MSEDPLRAFADIGLITHHFEGCEYYLSEIFQLLCESENDAPFQIFGQIVSSNMRLEMVKTAISHCLTRESGLKRRLLGILSDFKECQTLRNRAVHSSLLPVLKHGKLSYVRMPLWHQTQRYSRSKLKVGNDLNISMIKDAEQKIATLNIRMKGIIE